MDLSKKTELLHHVVASRNATVVEQLLGYGYDVNAVDMQGRTLLHVACSGFDVESVTVLFKYGADISKRNADDECPLQTLAYMYYYNCQLFRGDDLSEAEKQAYQKLHEDALKILEIFSKHGAALDATNEDDRAVARLCLYMGTKEFIPSLQTLGYDFSYADQSNKNRTMLHHVAEFGNAEVLKELLHHVDANCWSGLGTPLHVAAHFGKTKCVETLIEYGAALNMSEDQVITPLYRAFASQIDGSEATFEQLLHYRSGVNSVVLENSGFLNVLIHSPDIEVMDARKLMTLAKHIIKIIQAGFYVIPNILPSLLRNKELIQTLNVEQFRADCAKEN